MRLGIEIEDQLISEVLRVTGLKTKRDAVELGLRTLLCLHQQEQLRSLRGALEWQGDPDAMRKEE